MADNKFLRSSFPSRTGLEKSREKIKKNNKETELKFPLRKGKEQDYKKNGFLFHYHKPKLCKGRTMKWVRRSGKEIGNTLFGGNSPREYSVSDKIQVFQ